MFTALHGLGYFQRWFRGLFEKDHGSNLLDAYSRDPPRADRASYQTSFHIGACRSSAYFNLGGKCDMMHNAMEETKNIIKGLTYEIQYLKAASTFDELNVSAFDAQVYEKEDELERLRQKYRKLETELKRVNSKLWLERLRAKYQGPGSLGTERRESQRPSSSSSNNGYLDEDISEEIDIRINNARDIVAWDSRAKIESLFIGKGAYGQVSVYRYKKTLQPIAVKQFILSPEEATSEAIHQEIHREANELAALIGSDFFPRFYGLVRLSRAHYKLAMELVGDQRTGKTLRMSLALGYQGLVEGEETWFNIALDVVHGMAELHSRKRLHNDLKPDNIMLFRCPRRFRWAAKIIDLGMISTFERARIFFFGDEEETLYRTGENYLHMAPEVVLGRAPTSEKTDVFSLGYTLKKIARRKGVACLAIISRACLDVEASHRPTMEAVREYLDDLRSRRRMNVA